MGRAKTSIFRRTLALALGESRAADLDLESSGATEAHAEMLWRKPFLRKLYERYYAEFERAARMAPPGPRVEIGSGAGFLAEVVPGVVRLDLRPGARVDVVASALRMPFATRSLGAVFALNVLHHLPDLDVFFAELERVLAPGARAVFVEPFVSPISRILYRHGHHEPFDPEQRSWHLAGGGAMTAANDALPWIAFCRDRRRFEISFPSLEIEIVRPHTFALYALSGGFSYRCLVPARLFPALAAAEDLLGNLRGSRLLASMMTVTLVSRAR